MASGHDAGPETIGWHLERAGVHAPSRATIARILHQHGRVAPAARRRSPRPPTGGSPPPQPNECWQSDFTHVTLADGTDVEVITWLDDHSRMALHITAHPRVTGAIVLATFRAAVAEYGCPASTLTDNGMVYTVRHASQRVRGGTNAFETELATLGVTQKNGRGNHPQTQGKVERFQQTLKTWLARQGPPPETIADLQDLLDRFRHEYNHQRPHRSLGRRTPAAAYTARPKAAPTGEPADRTHTRVRHDKVNNGKITLRHGGTLYAIGLGRALNTRPVTALVHGLDITVLDATTGEILRELVLDTTRKYQPQHHRNPRT